MAIYPLPRASHNMVARLRVSDCVLKRLVARSIPAWMLFFPKGQTVSCGHQRMAIYPVPRTSHNNRVARLRVSDCVLKQLVARSIPAWILFFSKVRRYRADATEWPYTRCRRSLTTKGLHALGRVNCVLKQKVARSILRGCPLFFVAKVTIRQEGALVFKRLTF